MLEIIKNLSDIHVLVYILCFIIICVLCWSSYRLYNSKKLAHYYLDIIRTVSKGLLKNHEIVAFNHTEENIVYTTHPTTYFTKHDFVRSLSRRAIASVELQRLQNILENNGITNEIITGSGNGLTNGTKKWMVDCNVVKTEESFLDTDLSIIAITDITKHMDRMNKLEHNLEKLEIFLDKFPFGIFYINSFGIIVGANSTFSSMLTIKRERLLGLSITDFIENFNYNIAEQKPTQITVRPKFAPSYKAIIIKSQVQSHSMGQPWIICRIDQTRHTMQDNPDFLNQESFVYASMPSIIVTIKGEIIAINPAFATLIQGNVVLENENLVKIGSNISEHLQNTTNFKFDICELLKTVYSNTDNSTPIEIKFLASDIIAMAYMSKIQLEEYDKKLILIQLIDISEQKKLEQQFIQSQKMQAVGQLAGGIAHDFNNLLTAMMGFCDLLLQRHTPNDPSYGDVIQIKQNASRAANLVRQLLAFSRRQAMKPKVISVTDSLAELNSLLKRLIGAGIDFKIVYDREIWPVKVDNSQFEQVIINLAVNARDAMEGKDNASLIIQTKNFSSDTEFKCVYDVAQPGDYVLIEVKDNGIGIEPDIIESIFEPFFTKKSAKSGTGLGLSTVYGIVNQTGGFINVISTPGEGTNFQLYLPRYKGSESIQNTPDNIAFKDLSGSETILLVEDEEAVRMFLSRALKNKGYKVLEANCAEEAIKIVNNGEKFDLLITDVIMPHMDGPTLDRKLRESVSNIKTIFISGYAEDTFRKNLDKDFQIHFLQKPFTLKDLAIKAREVLN